MLIENSLAVSFEGGSFYNLTMAENATATEWPSTPIVPEAKALFDRLFEILDDNTPDAGQKLATEIFAPNAKFVTSSGVFQGEKGIYFPISIPTQLTAIRAERDMN